MPFSMLYEIGIPLFYSFLHLSPFLRFFYHPILLSEVFCHWDSISVSDFLVSFFPLPLDSLLLSYVIFTSSTTWPNQRNLLSCIYPLKWPTSTDPLMDVLIPYHSLLVSLVNDHNTLISLTSILLSRTRIIVHVSVPCNVAGLTTDLFFILQLCYTAHCSFLSSLTTHTEIYDLLLPTFNHHFSQC